MQNIQAQAALFKAWLRGPYIDLERTKGRAQGNHRGQGNQRHDDGHHGDVQVGLAVRQPANRQQRDDGAAVRQGVEHAGRHHRHAVHQIGADASVHGHLQVVRTQGLQRD